MIKKLLLFASAYVLLATSCYKDPYIHNLLIGDVDIMTLVDSVDTSGYNRQIFTNPDSTYHYEDIYIYLNMDYILAKQTLSIFPQAYAYQPGPSKYILQDSIESINFYTLDNYNTNYEANSNINTLLRDSSGLSIITLVERFNNQNFNRTNYSSDYYIFVPNNFNFKINEAPTATSPIRIYMIMKLYNNNIISSDTITLKVQ